MLANLGYNAIDAGAERLVVRLQNDGRQALLQVSDDGPRHERHPDREGLGIGLALVETTLETLGASLNLDFHRQWSQARIIWTPTGARRTPPPMATPESLLLLEDDELLARQTRRALARHGCDTHWAADLDGARRLLHRLPALDAAVLDQNLGTDNGLDLIAPLLQRFPDCRVIVLTGYGSIARRWPPPGAAPTIT